MRTRRLGSGFWRGFLAVWFLGILMVAVLGPTAAGAASAGSRRIAILGARSDLLGFLSAPPPSIPGATLENLSSADIAPSRLAQYDTLALLELCNVDPPLNASQLDAVEEWVKNGGKLLIWDSDRCVPSVDYRFLPYPWTTNNPGAKGNRSGTLDLLVDSPLGSGDPTSPAYVDMGSLAHDTDSGDTNVMVTHAPEWCAVISTTNLSGAVGASEAYAYAGKGLLIYAGFDLDYLGTNPQLNHLWQRQLFLAWDRDKGSPIPDLPPGPSCPQPVTGLAEANGMLRQLRPIGGTTVNLFLALLPILAVLFSFLILARRNELVLFVRAVTWFVATPGLWSARLLEVPAEGLAGLVRGAFANSERGIGYKSGENTHDLSPWWAWNLVGPVVYFVLFLVLVCSAFLTVGPKIALMLGVDFTLALPVDLGTVTGVLFVTTALIYSAVIIDLLAGTPIGRPWHNFSSRVRFWLLIMCAAGFLLTLVDDFLFNTWAAMLAPHVTFDEKLGELLPRLVLPLLGILLLGATALSGFSLFVGLGVIVALGLVAALLVVSGAWVVSVGAVLLLEAGRKGLTAFIDMPAWFFKAVWNAWFVDPGQRQYRKLGRLDVFLYPIVWVDPDAIDGDLERGLLRKVFEILRLVNAKTEGKPIVESEEQVLAEPEVVVPPRSPEPAPVSAPSTPPTTNGHAPETPVVLGSVGQPRAWVMD